jgi:hypothetical protein
MTFRIITIGHNFQKGPLKEGCRKSVIGFLFWLNAKVFMFVCGVNCSHRFLDADYSAYLGKDYKDTMKPIKKVSTIICNHVSWIDT